MRDRLLRGPATRVRQRRRGVCRTVSSSWPRVSTARVGSLLRGRIVGVRRSWRLCRESVIAWVGTRIARARVCVGRGGRRRGRWVRCIVAPTGEGIREMRGVIIWGGKRRTRLMTWGRGRRRALLVRMRRDRAALVLASLRRQGGGDGPACGGLVRLVSLCALSHRWARCRRLQGDRDVGEERLGGAARAHLRVGVPSVLGLADVVRAAVAPYLDFRRDAEVGLVKVLGADLERGELRDGGRGAQATALDVFDFVVGDQVLRYAGDGEGECLGDEDECGWSSSNMGGAPSS